MHKASARFENLRIENTFKVSEQMKMAVSEEPKRLMVKDVSKPVCGENDLLLKIHRASICATDLMYYERARRNCPQS